MKAIHLLLGLGYYLHFAFCIFTSSVHVSKMPVAYQYAILHISDIDCSDEVKRILFMTLMHS